MIRYAYTAVIVALFSVFAPTNSFAGDTGFGAFSYPVGTVYVGQDEPVRARLTNTLGFDVTGLKMTVTIEHDGKVIYEDFSEIEKVEKNSDFMFETGTSFKIDRIGDFQLKASFETDGSDINPDNNSTEYSFSSDARVSVGLRYNNFMMDVLPIIQRETGRTSIMDEIIYRTPQLIVPGVEIRYEDADDSETFTTDDYMWGFSYQLNPYQKLGSFSGMIFYSATDEDAEPVYTSGVSWPTLGGFAFPGEMMDNAQLDHTPELSTTLDETPIVSTPIGTDPPSKTCAILIAGRRKPNGVWDDHTNAFRRDVDSVYKEITTEKNGPNVAADNIAKLYDPTDEEVFKAAEALAKKGCTKLIFYYSGHGFKAQDGSTSLFLKGTRFPGSLMSQVMDYAAETGASDYVFIFDCCYAGDAKRQLKDAFSLDGSNVVILASSHRDSVSKTRITVVDKPGGGKDTTGFSEYTKALLESWGMTGIGTALEAHNDVIKRNPTIQDGGGKMNDVMKPNSLGKETKPTADGDISFEGLGVQFTGAMGFTMGSQLSVTTSGPVESFEPADNSVVSASSYRLWDISVSGQTGDFSTNISLKYDRALDGLADDIPAGVIRRSGTEPWSALPTEDDSDARIAVVYNIKSFSQWAIAATSLDPVSVKEDLNGESLGLRVRSNVVDGNLVADVRTSIGREVNYSIIEISTGRVAYTISERVLSGNTVKVFSTNGHSSGVYMLVATDGLGTVMSTPFMIVH